MTKSAEIFTDDSRNLKLKVTISGNVENLVKIVPRTVSLRGTVGDTIKKTVTIIPEKKYDFNITNVRARNGKYISYQLEEVKGSQRRQYALVVENLRTEPGRYSDMIILETDSQFRKNVNVRVYGILKKRPEQE
jgi:hypothetical protein